MNVFKKGISLVVALALALTMLVVPSFATASEVVSDVEATLRMIGPGQFSYVGEKGNLDLVTGIKSPGYNVVVERWNELYPNVKLEIEAVPWDNWKAVLQTAALEGRVDVLLHGASITAIAEPVQAYIDEDPEFAEVAAMMPMRKNDKVAPFSQYVPYGGTVIANPVLIVLDKEILANYGVEIPNGETWTLEDIHDIAKATTGIDPVTGKQTYGISLLSAGASNKNYIWASRAMDAKVFETGALLKDTKADFTSEKTKEVLTYIAELEKYCSPDYIEKLDLVNTYTEDNNIAMVIMESASSVFNTIKNNDLLDKFMFIQLPAIKGGEFDGITSSHMGDWNMAICNTSEQKDLAMEFIKFMITDPVVQQWIIDVNAIPNNRVYIDLLADVMPADYFNAVAAIVKTCPTQFSASANLCYDSGNFGTFANDITSVLNEMFTESMTVDEAIAFVQTNLDNYMNTLQ